MGSEFPNQMSNPYPLQWTHGVLASGLPENSRRIVFSWAFPLGLGFRFQIDFLSSANSRFDLFILRFFFLSSILCVAESSGGCKGRLRGLQ